MAVTLLLGQGDQDACDLRVRTHAPIAGGDARYMGGMRARTLYGLAQQVGGANRMRATPV